MSMENGNVYAVYLYIRLTENDINYMFNRLYLGIYSSKKNAADYIYESTGMHVNDDWEVVFLEDDTGGTAALGIEEYQINTSEYEPSVFNKLEKFEEIFDAV